MRRYKMDKEFSNEYIKHSFTDDKKAEIAIEMAQKVSELSSAEDDKKAVMSDFKSRIDLLQANVNSAATKLNNGYEMQNIKCEIVPDWDKKVWQYFRVDDESLVREKPMTADDLQMKLEEG